VKFVVDKALCSGHGQCAAVAPDVYALDDDGFNADAGRTVDIVEGKESAAQDGARGCPESAISLHN
jgi:ferredoxin